MDADLLHASRHLEPDAADTLAGARGRRITVLRGRLWLTVDHDPVDHVLGPGDSFTARDRRSLVVSAFGPTDYLVLEQEPA